MLEDMSQIHADMIGKAHVHLEGQRFARQRAYYLPLLKDSFISVSTTTQKGFDGIFKDIYGEVKLGHEP